MKAYVTYHTRGMAHFSRLQGVAYMLATSGVGVMLKVGDKY